MNAPADPYRTLGLPRTASLEEVKRAYRHLAKLYHPDSAGEGAVARFLGIQAAYEAITGLTARGPRIASRAAAERPTPPTWAAEAGRARATRPQARPGRPAGAGRSAGPEGQRSGSERPASPGVAGGRSSSSRGRAGRAAGRATMGSTSYDGADDEPFEPDWSGGSWYGAGSGTYWRVNPREYADPRKHGPEYQARGRRPPSEPSRTARGRSGGSPAGAPSAGAPSAEAAGGAHGAGSNASWTEAANPNWAPGSAGGRGWSEAAAGRADPGWADAARQAWQAEAAEAGATGSGAPGVPSWVWGPTARRLVPLLLAWPPIGFVLAALVGEVTGCGRYSAGCSDAANMLPWLMQPLVIGLLLALPVLASVAAIGTLGALLAAVPVAVVLSVTGGGRGPVAMTAALLVVALAAGYIIGTIGAAIGRFRLPDAPHEAVDEPR